MFASGVCSAPAVSLSAKIIGPPKLLDPHEPTRELPRLECDRAAAVGGCGGGHGVACPLRQSLLGAPLGRGGTANGRAGRVARELVERAREALAALVGGDPDGVVFVSGGTEANHLALFGSRRERVLVSAIEHSSVLQAVPAAERIAVDANGIVDLARIEEQLPADPRPALVSVMLANNETGVIEPVAEIAAITHRHGALFHCDAVQAAGKIPVDVATIGADLLSLSAHKLGGPPGTGALIVRGMTEPAPTIRGGGQERGRRAGSENLLGIAGFAAAASAAMDSLADYGRVRQLRDSLEASLVAAAPDAIVIGAAAPRLPNTSAIALPGVAAETQVIALDLDGVKIRAGAACFSGKVAPT